jgi:hypothetical protein
VFVTVGSLRTTALEASFAAVTAPELISAVGIARLLIFAVVIAELTNEFDVKFLSI